MKTLIVDCNNLAFVTRFSKLPTPNSKRKKDPNATEFILFGMLEAVASLSTKMKCDSIMVACDSKNVWRRDVYPDYKQGSKTKEDMYYKEVIEASNHFIEFMRDNTSALVLSVDRCEADDIIGYWCLNMDSDHEAIIMSTDKDYMQLISDNVGLFSVTDDDYRHSDDPEYDLFIKSIRGDRNDNIPSAFPRVRTARLKKAYEDDMELLNLVETVLDSGDKVGTLYERNSDLIDLSRQPESIKTAIQRRIDETETSKFSEIKSMKALGEFGIKSKSDVLEGRSKAFKTKPAMKE